MIAKKQGHIRKVVALLTVAEKRRLWIVIAASIFSALIEAIGIGSITPFVTVASKPDIIRTNEYLARVFNILGFESETSFIVFLGIVVLGMIVITNLSQALLQYIKVRFSNARRHSLSLRLLMGYLRQTYPFFLNQNSYDLVKNINIEVGTIVSTILLQLVELLSRSIQVALIGLFLIVVNPTNTIQIALAIICIYGIIYASVRRISKRLGSERYQLYAERARIVSEAFWGIKEMKLAGVEREKIAEYRKPSLRISRNMTINTIVSTLPRFVLETAAFSAIIGYVLFKIIRTGGFIEAAGSITLFAYAGYRLIPKVQAVFKSLTALRYGAETAEKISAEFEKVAQGSSLPSSKIEKLPFNNVLELEDIYFTYPNVSTPVINGLSLRIPANSLIGFAGKTGSGKTTLVDIVMGLLPIQSGVLMVDEVPLEDGNIRRWQANIGYVPQNIYLSNDSITANIAFGVRKSGIDMHAVEKAGKLSQIHNFICEELPEGYDTKIGERGIRLSGGQRQRIGIARALYRDPCVLIMDEGTSSLDSHTERAVMGAIDTLQGTRTIILIAHRLTTLKKCDLIYVIEKGEIVDSGTYSELHSRSKYFAS